MNDDTTRLYIDKFPWRELDGYMCHYTWDGVFSQQRSHETTMEVLKNSWIGTSSAKQRGYSWEWSHRLLTDGIYTAQ